MYSTAQLKLVTCEQAHECACMFQTCKTSKTGVCTVAHNFGVSTQDSVYT